MDSEKVEAFKKIVSRISDSAIDEIVEDGGEVNSVTFLSKMEEKFERFAKLVG